MNADILSEWFHRQGYRVARTDSSYWYEAGPGVYQAFPFHWVIHPSEAELRDLLKKQKAVAVRYSAPVDSGCGCISYHTIFNKDDYTLDLLDRRTRQNVRRGLKHCEVKPLSCERYAYEGWHLEADTMDRQRRQGNQCRETWYHRCMAMADLPGFEIWGAIVDGQIAASLLTFQMGKCCEMITQQCRREFLIARVNNALTYTVTQNMVRRPGTQTVFYSLHSLDAPDSVDTYKFRMGYLAKPVRQRVVFNPWLKPFTHGISHKIISIIRKRASSNHFLSKTEGLLRFYQQGKRPLADQSWPKCLSNMKTCYFQRNAK